MDGCFVQYVKGSNSQSRLGGLNRRTNNTSRRVLQMGRSSITGMKIRSQKLFEDTLIISIGAVGSVLVVEKVVYIAFDSLVVAKVSIQNQANSDLRTF